MRTFLIESSFDLLSYFAVIYVKLCRKIYEKLPFVNKYITLLDSFNISTESLFMLKTFLSFHFLLYISLDRYIG